MAGVVVGLGPIAVVAQDIVEVGTVEEWTGLTRWSEATPGAARVTVRPVAGWEAVEGVGVGPVLTSVEAPELPVVPGPVPLREPLSFVVGEVGEARREV